MKGDTGQTGEDGLQGVQVSVTSEPEIYYTAHSPLNYTIPSSKMPSGGIYMYMYIWISVVTTAFSDH